MIRIAILITDNKAFACAAHASPSSCELYYGCVDKGSPGSNLRTDRRMMELNGEALLSNQVARRLFTLPASGLLDNNTQQLLCEALTAWLSACNREDGQVVGDDDDDEISCLCLFLAFIRYDSSSST